MKRLLCAVAALALMVPAAASAQPQDRGGSRAEQNRPARQRPQKSTARAGKPRPQARTTRQGRAARSSHATRPTREARPAHARQRTHVARPGHAARPEATGRHVPAPARTQVYRPGHRPSTYHRVRAPAFHYPHGYRYRHWSIGSILPRLFLSSPYYWNDWTALGLGPPPPGYVWVRYGPDLLLVNRYTGRVVDVIYGAFY